MAKPKGRAKEFADWEEKLAQDYDPEAEAPADNDASDSGESVDEDAGTEHYVSVGKSKLQRKELVSLGPQYRGSRVSRAALTQSASESSDYEDAREDLDSLEKFDDPEEADLERDEQEDEEDAEIESDNAFGESDEERFGTFTFRSSSQALPVRGKKIARPIAADFMDEEAEESEDSDGGEGALLEDEEDEEDSEDADESDLDGFINDDSDMVDDESVSSDESASGNGDIGQDDEKSGDSEDSEADHPEPSKKHGGPGLGMVQAMMKSGTESAANSVASSIQKDIAKGVAVRQQRKSFDAALNVRIRLQKAMIAVNSLGVSDDADNQSEPYEAAEAAAVKLWNAIDDFRTGLQTQTGQKRKRAVETSTSSRDIWNNMQDSERQAMVRRRAVLENWSGKVKATQTVNDTAGHVRSASRLVKVGQPLTMMLETQMQDPERLVKRTRTPRSCAPVQAAQKVNEDENIYDDADFYQLLLKELVDQRTTDTSSASGQAAATVRYAAVKEAKNKQHVDTKASKGRKMRFNLHEKLQNFMASEDRRNWEQDAIDRFFGSLFGQKTELNEDNVSDEEMGGVTVEEEGLRLFRS
ncbi:BFR2 protein [Xylariales sp. AK1849]|nr:BFR2 protein [Xylariales sp. AK1849]